MSSVRCELAAAHRAVNAAFARLPKSVQDEIEIAYDPLNDEVDAAILADDRERSLTAIAAWRRHWIDIFEAHNEEEPDE